MNITNWDVSDAHKFIYGEAHGANPAQAIKRLTVRTDAPLGSLARKFAGTYPPAPTVKAGKAAITGGYEFTWNLSRGHSVKGYNVYRGTVNNAGVATFLRFISNQPPTDARSSITFQDITAIGAPLYWVASVNSAGKESVRIPMSGAAAPTAAAPAAQQAGGGSGANSAGGMIGTDFDIPW